MINRTTRERFDARGRRYTEFASNQQTALREIALAELAESVQQSYAIENSTLILTETERILAVERLGRRVELREVCEARKSVRRDEGGLRARRPAGCQ